MVACRRQIFATLLLLIASAPALAEHCVVDDIGQQLCLAHAAQRIITLSPGATELVYAAGAGDKLVAAVSYSDYPEAAKKLPRIGTYSRFDQEAILALKPDLLIGWHEGNPAEQLRKLASLNLAIYYSDVRKFEDIAHTIERLGVLAGTAGTANSYAADFRQQVSVLKNRFASAAPVSVFQQIWVNPLMTVNGSHIISEATRLCGGVNAFSGLSSLSARIDLEAVLATDPEAIIAGGMGEENHQWLEDWRRFGNLTAVSRNNLFFISPSHIQRPTPRILLGTKLLCEHLETARGRR
ncbi:MAG: cobalamin-binding protein [Spongiibacteraceae bacterium]